MPPFTRASELGEVRARMRRSVQELDLSLQLRAEVALPVLATMQPGEIGDLGCGTGCFSAMLARRGRTVSCVDVTPANLEALRGMYSELVERGLLHPLLGDITQIPLETDALAGAYCMEVLEHVDDDLAAVSEIARVLRPGAILVVTVPNRVAPLPLVERLGFESVHDRPGPEHHVRPGYEARELCAILSRAGFDVLSVSGVGGRLYRLTAGLVSFAHHAYKRARGEHSWTWADLEHDASSLPMRLYGAVFPVLLFLAKRDRSRDVGSLSTLVVTARRRA